MEKEILYSDTNRIAKICGDLEFYGKTLERLFAELESANLLYVERTDDVISDVVSDGGHEIKRAIQNAYDLEASKIAFAPERKRLLAAVADDWDKADRLIAGWRELLEKDKMKLYNGISDYDRLKYLHFDNGAITYDRDAVVEDNSTYCDDPRQKKLLNRAISLHKQMVDFDREVRALSDGRCYGIICEGPANDGFITCSDGGMLHLDLKYIAWLDFGNADELLKKKDTIENSKIWEVER